MEKNSKKAPNIGKNGGGDFPGRQPPTLAPPYGRPCLKGFSKKGKYAQHTTQPRSKRFIVHIVCCNGKWFIYEGKHYMNGFIIVAN